MYKRPAKTYTLERLVKKPSISSYDKSALTPAWLKCTVSLSFVKNCSLAPCSSRDVTTGLPVICTLEICLQKNYENI